MYRAVDQHLANNNVNEAMGECIRNNFYHLGRLLGRLHNRESTGDGNFHQLLGQLEINSEKVQLDNIPINEVDEIDDVENPSVLNDVPELKEIPEPVKKVKILCNWLDSKDIANCWNKMSKGNYRWNSIQLVWAEEPDYYVVINCPPIGEFPNYKKTIVFRMEPNMEQHEELWGDWANPDASNFLKICYHKDEYNNNEWHLAKTYSQLKSLEICKDPNVDGIVSTVLSSKYSDPGHVKRIDFVKFLEQKGLNVHVFGSNKWNYKNYKGPLPYHEKDNALMPYKYTFNVENHEIANYFTEKIIDGILSECLVFYSGCFNLQEYLPKQAFVYLELSNFELDYSIMKKAIEENWWQQRLPHIREAKRRILEELQFFPRVERIIKEYEQTQ